MERRLTEERVTKSLIKWLVENDWTIISFDYPQSGTGRALHPNDEVSKTEGIIIPDIVAHKGDKVIFFENKDRFVLADYEKVENLRLKNNYSRSIRMLTSQYSYKSIFYGIGQPNKKVWNEKAIENSCMVDFVAVVNADGTVMTIYDSSSIF